MTVYKVAIISDWFLPRIGGLELHMRDLARELRARGHEAHIITATPGPASVDGIPVHRLDVPLMPGLHTIRSREALAPLERLFRQERYDIAHCHTILSPLSHAAAYVAKQLGVPCVLTEHSVLRGAIPVFQALDYLWRWASWPDVVSAVSGYVAAELQRISGRDDVAVLPNGIDVASWRGARPAEEELRVVSVMRFTKRKRPVDIIRAIPQVLAQLPGSLRPRFTLIGDGPERERVEREVRRLGVGEHVELPGFLPRPEIRRVLSRSAVFVLPTEKEALSIATLEARCVGLPVVAMNLGGVGDLIRHGCEGFLADSWDEFIHYIVRLVKDADLRRRMAESTLKSIDRFSWDQVIARHEDLYDLAERRCLNERARAGQQPAPRLAPQLLGLRQAPAVAPSQLTPRRRAAKG